MYKFKKNWKDIYE